MSGSVDLQKMYLARLTFVQIRIAKDDQAWLTLQKVCSPYIAESTIFSVFRRWICIALQEAEPRTGEKLGVGVEVGMGISVAVHGKEYGLGVFGLDILAYCTRLPIWSSVASLFTNECDLKLVVSKTDVFEIDVKFNSNNRTEKNSLIVWIRVCRPHCSYFFCCILIGTRFPIERNSPRATLRYVIHHLLQSVFNRYSSRDCRDVSSRDVSSLYIAGQLADKPNRGLVNSQTPLLIQ